MLYNGKYTVCIFRCRVCILYATILQYNECYTTAQHYIVQFGTAVPYQRIQYSILCHTVTYWVSLYSSTVYCSVALCCNLLWYTRIQRSIIQYSTVQHSTVQYSVARHSMVQYQMVWCNVVQCSVLQYRTKHIRAHNAYMVHSTQHMLYRTEYRLQSV